MKQFKEIGKQLVNAVLLAALTVPLILMAISLEQKPTLYVEGARIQVAQDGSVQLLFNVSIGNTSMTDGAHFDLKFNGKYITPSDYATNEVLTVADGPNRAYRIPETLYQIDSDNNGIFEFKNPFKEPDGSFYEKRNGLTLNGTGEGTLSLTLLTDGSIAPEKEQGVGMKTVEVGEGDERYNVFDATNKLTICTLSFRVIDTDLMPEITRLFDGIQDALIGDNHAHGDTNTKLLYFTREAMSSQVGEWFIGILTDEGEDYRHTYVTDYRAQAAQAAFSYRFPKTIIKARAAEADLTLNAYQVYTDGTVSDIDEALQRYSPAITVTYSDGSEGNFIMPWSRTGTGVDGLPWTATEVRDKNDTNTPVVVDGTPGVNQVTYDPTASRYKPGDDQHYLVEKRFCYQEQDFDGIVRDKVFPTPIPVKLTVTPITLVDVTATDLHRSYILNNTLVSGANAVQTAGALHLPNQARLITDIPAGGVTLTMDIHGWSHPQTYGVDGGGTVTRYWPSQRLDTDNVTVIGTGTEIVNLWKDGTTEADSVYLHWPTADDLQASPTAPWMSTEANNAYLGANRAGVYTFKMAESYGGDPTHFTRAQIRAAYPWLTVPDSTKVAGDVEAWPIEDATRTIVWNEDPDRKPEDPILEDKIRYDVKYISTVTTNNEQPELTLRVRKRTGGENSSHENLPEGSLFRIKLPDGTELGIGTVGGVTLDDWFAQSGTQDDGRHYTRKPMVEQLGSYNRRVFDLVTNPGDPTVVGYETQRELLRRYINLGGWFSVSIKEEGQVAGTLDDSGNASGLTAAQVTTWSDFIPVYVPPRDNYYTEDKVYNFIGDNAGLYPWSGGVSTTVILPPGTYDPLDIRNGEIIPLYEYTTVPNPDPSQPPTEVRGDRITNVRYGVSTTYDGTTGAQPGELNTFTIDPVPTPPPDNTWQTASSIVQGHSIKTYGPEYFKDNALYSAYGRVLNLMTDRSMNPVNYIPGTSHTATIRTEKEEAPAQNERLVLEYVSTNGGEASYNTDGTNVTNVIFETRTQGYTLRQDYTLVLRNEGTVDIDGISLDTLTDLAGNATYDEKMRHTSLGNEPAGGHFEILKPPASFLPAGESTTFVITYVYNLKADASTPIDYRDKIFITSNSKHTVGLGTTAGTDYLLDFDAQFQVTSSDIHRVIVNVVPARGVDKDGNVVDMPLGTAGVIVGETDNGSGGKNMNTASGPTAFVQGNQVYILVSPKDEYTRLTVTAVDTTGRDLSPVQYSGTATIPDGHEVYVFTMPDYDATVTVTFEEPVRSKLRLSDLRVYADADRYHDEGDPSHSADVITDSPGCLYPHNPDWDNKTSPKYKSRYQQRIWQKSFTKDETDKAEAIRASHNNSQESYRLSLMTQGRSAKPDFDSQVDQYLVVLPFDADWAQVEVDLREVVYLFTGDPILNEGLTGINVSMTLFDTMNVDEMMNDTSPTNTNIYPTTYLSSPYAGYHTGTTNPPTTHTSIPFLSPDPGKSKYVRVQLSYTAGGSGSAGETETRSYYIELHRATENVVAELNYGNSPYGMIMNAGNVTDKAGAKTAFVDNNYTFKGMDASLIPDVVTAENGLLDLHYWLETWAAPTETWTAPNAYWIPNLTLSKEENEARMVYDADTGMGKVLYEQVHLPEVNLDLNDYAFFALMGEAFKDPGIKQAVDSSGRLVDLTKAELSLTVNTLNSEPDKDVPANQLSRFTLPTDADGLKARTITFGFLDKNDSTVAVSGDTVTTDWAKWYLTSDNKLTQEAAGNTLVELRPGRYRLTYTFPDYNYIPADPANGIAEEGDHLSITRDFVVLAPVGDVNADLSVTRGRTGCDEALIEQRVAPNMGYPSLGYMAYQNDAIFKLRTCDVNNDRNINNIDANAVKENTTVKRFYLSDGYASPAPVTP